MRAAPESESESKSFKTLPLRSTALFPRIDIRVSLDHPELHLSLVLILSLLTTTLFHNSTFSNTVKMKFILAALAFVTVAAAQTGVSSTVLYTSCPESAATTATSAPVSVGTVTPTWTYSNPLTVSVSHSD